MPRYKTNEKDENQQDVYQDICNPITKEFREKLYGSILETHQQERAKRLEAATEKPLNRREKIQQEANNFIVFP